MKSSAFSNRHVILVFVDGLGIGEENPEYNPCCHTRRRIFCNTSFDLLLDGQKFALDACLGVEGLPQSGSGQTTIYTGENAARLIGRHLFGFPNRQLKDLINSKSIFKAALNEGYSCKFINAFRPVFFSAPELFKNIRMSATTEMNRSVQLPFCSIRQITKGEALYHDYSNEVLRRLGFRVPLYSAENAAEVLIGESKKFDLILYEFFLTDMAGHSKDMSRAVHILQRVEDLLHALIEQVDLKETVVLMVSDHGNIEDMRTKSHTKNPAFMGLWGAHNNENNVRIRSLTDIYPLVMQLLTG